MGRKFKRMAEMDWLKQVPDAGLIDVADGVPAGLAAALQEYRAARYNLVIHPGNEAAQVRSAEAKKLARERLNMYDACSAELHARGLK
jgi:hypothetical protein